MSEHETGQPGSGEDRARRRQRRVWTAVLLPGLVAFALLMAVRTWMGVPLGFGLSVWRPTPGFAVLAVVVTVIAVAVGAIWQHRVIDEQEERAILWGGTVGFYVALVSAMAADAFRMANLIPAVPHLAVLAGSLVAAVLTYAWVRFR